MDWFARFGSIILGQRKLDRDLVVPDAQPLRPPILLELDEIGVSNSFKFRWTWWAPRSTSRAVSRNGGNR